MDKITNAERLIYAPVLMSEDIVIGQKNQDVDIQTAYDTQMPVLYQFSDIGLVDDPTLNPVLSSNLKVQNVEHLKF